MSDWRLIVYPVLAFAVLRWMYGRWEELQHMKEASRYSAVQPQPTSRSVAYSSNGKA